MKLPISMLTILPVILYTNCTRHEDRAMIQSWMNVKYVACVRGQLPCECEKNINGYFSLVLDTNRNSNRFGVALSSFESMEPDIYPIRKVKTDEFLVLKSLQDTSVWAVVKLKNDTASFFDDGKTTKFTGSPTSKTYDLSHYYKDNVKLLNDALRSRGYLELEKILKRDSLHCDCNKWMGHVNLVSVQDAPASWILSIENDSLKIRTIVNNSDRDPDDPVETQLLASYKWR